MTKMVKVERAVVYTLTLTLDPHQLQTLQRMFSKPITGKEYQDETGELVSLSEHKYTEKLREELYDTIKYYTDKAD